MTIVNTSISAAAAAAAERAAPRVASASPTTGATVVMQGGTTDSTVNLTPAGTLLNLTVTMPPSPQLGDKARIVTSNAITNLTINGATTILGSPGTLLTGGSLTFGYEANNTWMVI